MIEITGVAFASVFVVLYFSLNKREGKNPGIRIERVLEDAKETDGALRESED